MSPVVDSYLSVDNVADIVMVSCNGIRCLIFQSVYDSYHGLEYGRICRYDRVEQRRGRKAGRRKSSQHNQTTQSPHLECHPPETTRIPPVPAKDPITAEFNLSHLGQHAERASNDHDGLSHMDSQYDRTPLVDHR